MTGFFSCSMCKIICQISESSYMLYRNFILFSRKQKSPFYILHENAIEKGVAAVHLWVPIRTTLHTAWKDHWKGFCTMTPTCEFQCRQDLHGLKGILLVFHPPWHFQCISLLILRGWNFFHFPRIKLPNQHRTLIFKFVGYFHNWFGSKVLRWFLRVLRMFSSFYSFFSPGPVFFSFSSKYSNSIILNLLNQHHHSNKPKTLYSCSPEFPAA